MPKVSWYVTRSGDYTQGPYTGTVIGCYYDSTKKCAMLLVAEDGCGAIREVTATSASYHTV
jgi:hypothetical protein